MGDKFTNTKTDGEVTGYNPDARGDIYDIEDYDRDHNYWQAKIADVLRNVNENKDNDCYILYGGEVTNAGSGLINIAAGAAVTKDSDGNVRFCEIPAQSGVSLPSGWNDDRQIWVILQYEYALSTETRNHAKTSESYHYVLEDNFSGNSDTDDLFVDSDPNSTPDTVVCLGSFQMSGGGVFTDLSSGERSPVFSLSLEGPLLANDTTQSTDKDTGSIITEGGLGVEKNANIGGVLKIADTTDSTTKDTGSIITEGGVGVEKTLITGGKVLVKDTTDSTTKDTGSIITEGGIGVEKTLVTGGKVLVKDTTNAVNKDTGSIITEGGIGVELNIYVGGNVAASGSFIGLRREIGTTFVYTTSNTEAQVYTGISGLISGGPYICHGDVVIAGVNYSLLYIIQVTSSPNYIQLYYYNGTIITYMLFYDGDATNIPYNIGGVI